LRHDWIGAATASLAGNKGRLQMKSMLLAIPLLLLLGMTANARDLKSEIDAANQRFGKAFDQGDAVAVARLYMPHATVFPPGSDMVTGRDGIQKVWAGVIQSGLKFTAFQTVSVEQYGNAVREIGRFSAQVPDAQKQMTSNCSPGVIAASLA
jgi:ketosteroid isomerase-like protein